MIEWARKLSPEIEFRVGDMRALELPDGAGLIVLERVEREPYPEVEHPSRRGYLLARSP